MSDTDKHAVTPLPLHPLFAARWSPRAYDSEHALPATDLHTILEAARWSPSASNTQPWRFIVGRRNSQEFNTIMGALSRGNASWAGNAAALLLSVAVTESDDGNMYRWAQYDLGQAVAHLTLQAHALGYHAHQLGGFNVESLKLDFDLQDRFEPMTVIALGVVGDTTLLPERYQAAETAPRTRLPLKDILLNALPDIIPDN